MLVLPLAWIVVKPERSCETFIISLRSYLPNFSFPSPAACPILELILKNVLLTFKSLHGMAPSYSTELLHHHSLVRSLRSYEKALVEIPRSGLKTKADRAFAVSAPTFWEEFT